MLRSRCGPAADPPRKRVDTSRVAVPGEAGKNGFTYSQLSQGSPLTARRQLFRWGSGQCVQSGKMSCFEEVLLTGVSHRRGKIFGLFSSTFYLGKHPESK